MSESALILLLVLAPIRSDQILCPAYPDDPPWRWMTCFMLSRMGVPPDRPEPKLPIQRE